MNPLVLWYSLCVVGGFSSSLLSPFLMAAAIVGALILFGVILANSSDRPEGLDLHHAIIGLAVALAVNRGAPLVVLTLFPAG